MEVFLNDLKIINFRLRLLQSCAQMDPLHEKQQLLDELEGSSKEKSNPDSIRQYLKLVKQPLFLYPFTSRSRFVNWEQEMQNQSPDSVPS